ncbi:MAG: DUF968 domain-containing protein [Terrimicrobiaceae bacterium]|nr:DUF968 domain-containing protein [Terrimicrobiaceae bacterium]
MTRDVLPFPKPVRMTDPNYLRFIRRQPCCVSGTASEASHIVPEGWGKTGSKVSDYRTAPMNWRLHKEYHRIGRKAFEAKYAIDLDLVQLQYLETYISALRDGEDLGQR